MTIPIRVLGASDFRIKVGSVLSSLPISFSTRDSNGDRPVIALDGRGAWAQQAIAAIEDEALAVWVMEPTPIAPRDIALVGAIAATHGISVRLGRQWAGHVAAAMIAQRQRADREPLLLHSHATLKTYDALVTLLTAQVDLIQSAFAGDVSIEHIDVGSDVYVASGQFTGDGTQSALALSGALTETEPAVIARELSYDGRSSITVGDGFVARAATASVGGPDGELLLPLPFETAYRVSLRALATDLEQGVADREDLVAFGSAVAASAVLTRAG